MFSNHLVPLPVAPCRSLSLRFSSCSVCFPRHFSSFSALCQGQPSALSPWEILGGASEIASRMRYWKRVSTDFRRFTSWRSTNCCDSLVITGQSPCRFSVCPSGLASLRSGWTDFLQRKKHLGKGHAIQANSCYFLGPRQILGKHFFCSISGTLLAPNLCKNASWKRPSALRFGLKLIEWCENMWNYVKWREIPWIKAVESVESVEPPIATRSHVRKLGAPGASRAPSLPQSLPAPRAPLPAPPAPAARPNPAAAVLWPPSPPHELRAWRCQKSSSIEKLKTRWPTKINERSLK